MQIAAKFQKCQVQCGIKTETSGYSHPIAPPGQSKARNQPNHHYQQTYLQESCRTLKNQDRLDDLVSALALGPVQYSHGSHCHEDAKHPKDLESSAQKRIWLNQMPQSFD